MNYKSVRRFVVGLILLIGVVLTVTLTVSAFTVIIKLKWPADFRDLSLVNMIGGVIAIVGMAFARLSTFFLLVAFARGKIRRWLWNLFSILGIFLLVQVSVKAMFVPVTEIEYPLLVCFQMGAFWMLGLLLFHYLAKLNTSEHHGHYQMDEKDRRLGTDSVFF